ncbi:MAG TPA: hypothetical protein VGL56_20970 [Fimbriimonadaceae bacterium]|jgi:hypothetical protein
MRVPSEQRLENLRRRRSQIDAEVQRLEAINRAGKHKADTRRKILIGAVVLQEMEKRLEFKEWVKNLLAERLTRPRDRALFGLISFTDDGSKAEPE